MKENGAGRVRNGMQAAQAHGSGDMCGRGEARRTHVGRASHHVTPNSADRRRQAMFSHVCIVIAHVFSERNIPPAQTRSIKMVSPCSTPTMTRTTALALLASTLLLDVTAQTQPVPTLCGFECLKGQYVVGGAGNWALTGSTYNVAVTFMSNFCGASIGNTAVNCTGAALGSTRRVLQANGIYITEQLQNLTLTHPKGTHRKGTHPKGTLSQVVTSTDPDAYDEGTWTYYDYAHLSDIQVYHNHSTDALSMSMTTHKCVSNATMGDAAVVGLLAKAQAYYISAIANATAAQSSGTWVLRNNKNCRNSQGNPAAERLKGGAIYPQGPPDSAGLSAVGTVVPSLPGTSSVSFIIRSNPTTITDADSLCSDRSYTEPLFGLNILCVGLCSDLRRVIPGDSLSQEILMPQNIFGVEDLHVYTELCKLSYTGPAYSAMLSYIYLREPPQT
ncbi:hypothetical protein B0H17DRAFT_1144990 [Mycena rosella]|uniref:Uncharacterized protein n=1 Tax=Mycena rosella TaxID=1033263 RepID=A0AAD7CRR7_MYCRO|nr:hypothetical protein B0H17DRAFT_1144990 [Mycena rosella]